MSFKKSILALLSVTAMNCSTDHYMPQLTVQQLLTSGDWYVSQWLFTDGSSPTIDIITDKSNSLPTCRKDDYFTFSQDGAFTQSEGATECDKKSTTYAPISMTKSGWKLSNDLQKLTFTNVGQSVNSIDNKSHTSYFFPSECIILQLDESTLVMQGTTDQNNDTHPETSVYTFKRANSR